MHRTVNTSPRPARTRSDAGVHFGGFAHTIGIGLLPMLLLAGCGGSHKAEPKESGNQEIIGGFAANDPRFDVVGSLVLVYPPESGLPPRMFCSASLISPSTVLTAKHCAVIVPQAAAFGLGVAFALGPNSAAPRRMAEVVDFDLAPGDTGGFVGYGRDVATVHLDTPLEGEALVSTATLTDGDIGRPLAVVGYGAQDNARQAGTRRVGKETLRGREGKVFEIMFGSFEAFYDWFKQGQFSAPPGTPTDAGVSPPTADGGAGPGVDAGPPVDWLEEYARFEYNNTLLEKEYEVVTGGAAYDAQTCFGDSGGPLLRRLNNENIAYGVVSGGVGSRDLICDKGTVYASFGPETMAFLDRARAWTDPCADLTTKGACDGTVAKRCTNPAEGRRRVVAFDCASFGLECTGGQDQVACGDIVLAPPAPTGAPTPEAAGTLVKKVEALYSRAVR